ncbi:MAG: phage major capsid protein [Acutalibacteraceae bacterium]
MNTNLITTHDPEYDKAFWNAMKGNTASSDALRSGKTSMGTIKLPSYTAGKFTEALANESLFRKIGTVFYNQGDHKFWARDCDDTASFVPEGSAIPIYDGMDDFTSYDIYSHKLAAVIRMDEDFVFSPGYNLEKHMTAHLTKAFSRAEEKAFIKGNGITEPVGILADNGGAEVGTTASALTYDDVMALYFSVKPEYRKNGKWLMNDETAFALRRIKDADGNYIWNHSNDTILGKEVLISEYMPNATAGASPVAFGDFSYYAIVDRDHTSVKALREKFAINSQIGYLGIEFLDGKLVRPEAIKVLKIKD